jgi:hypothetical protein
VQNLAVLDYIQWGGDDSEQIRSHGASVVLSETARPLFEAPARINDAGAAPSRVCDPTARFFDAVKRLSPEAKGHQYQD